MLYLNHLIVSTRNSNMIIDAIIPTTRHKEMMKRAKYNASLIGNRKIENKNMLVTKSTEQSFKR